MQAETSLNAKRVAQIDAHSLDQILISYFRNKLDEIFLLLFSNGDHAKWRRYWDFYLRPCLVPVLYYAPRIFTGYTPGQRMMNVTFNKQHWKLKNALVHYGFAVLFPSFLRILSETSRHKAFEQCENIFRFLGLIHFFVFLIHGGPFSLIERFLGVRTIHVEPPKLGLLNFFDLNRELIAHFLGHVVLFFFAWVCICVKYIQKVVDKTQIQQEAFRKNYFSYQRAVVGLCRVQAIGNYSGYFKM